MTSFVMNFRNSLVRLFALPHPASFGTLALVAFSFGLAGLMASPLVQAPSAGAGAG
jgi:hypothetical protein